MIAVIMCGGMGTRMRPITELIPKPLLQVAGREILDILIEKLTQAGVETIYLTLGFKAQQIIEYVESKNYSVNIITVTESTPLGTAGGVKNAIGETMEDVIVLSGDNIFGYDLKDAYQQHLKSNADVSIIGAKRDDPRDYGTVQLQEDGTILSFIEKPSWAQAESNIINTGIYFLKGKILSLIPLNKIFDFAGDLFPLLMEQGYLFHCIEPDGEWGDLGDLTSYLDANRKALDGVYGNVVSSQQLISENKILANGTEIVAPCIIGKNVRIESNCKIGPYVILCDNCSVGQNSLIDNCIISEGCTMDTNFVCSGAFIGESCHIGSCVCIAEGAILAGRAEVGNYSVITKGSKIYPGCIIHENECNTDGQILSDENIPVLTAKGICGKAFHSFTISNAFAVGASVGSCKDITRVGISDDGNVLSTIYKNSALLGLQACGCTVYDFAEIVRSQRIFLSQYSKLDFFISITTNEDTVDIAFSGKNGAPVSRKKERELQAAYRYNAFHYAAVDKCKEVFYMQPLVAVYRSYLTHRLPVSNEMFSVAVECDNRYVYEMLREALHNKQYPCGYGGILFMIDRNGEKFYAVENERAYSYDRILSICCKFELEEGNNIAVGEAAPGILEKLAEEHNRKVFRLYEAENDINDEEMQHLLASPWIFDGILCIIKLLDIMQMTDKTLQQLSDDLPDCFVKSMLLSYTGEPQMFKKRILANGAMRSTMRQGYYEWEDERGVIRMKPDAACRNIRVLIESDNMEMSRELSADAELKIRNCAIDKLC